MIIKSIIKQAASKLLFKAGLAMCAYSILALDIRSVRIQRAANSLSNFNIMEIEDIFFSILLGFGVVFVSFSSIINEEL